MLKIAEEAGCDIKNKVLNDIKNFWNEGTETVTSQKLEAASLETEISVGTKGILAGVLDVFAKNKNRFEI